MAAVKNDTTELRKKFEKALQRPILTSTLLGLVPFKADSRKCDILTTIYFIINSSALLLASCQMCIDLLDGSPKDVNTVIEIILNTGVFFSAFILMIMYRFKVKVLSGLISLGYEHFRFYSQYAKNDQLSVESTLDVVNVGVPVLILCTYVSSYQWLILPIFFTDPDGCRVLPVETTYPYPAHQSPYYELTFAYQAYLFTLIAFIYSHVNATFTSLTILICIQYDILCCNIRNSTNFDISSNDTLPPTFYNLMEERHHKDKPDDKCFKKLNSTDIENNTLKAIADCVEFHKNLKKFCRELQNYFNLPFSFQLFMVVITMGCAVISFLQKLAMNTLQFTMISLTFLSILCYQGQQILHKSGNIHDAAWQSDWQRHGTRVRKAYIFIMNQAIFPDGIAVGYGLFQLNLTNLIAILRASFSFFTLLDNMIKPNKN